MYCYYCGLPADGIDHVVPQSLLNAAKLATDLDSYLALQARGRIMTVPSCQQCNSILGAHYDHTLEARKARLKDRLRTKLKKHLSMPDWSDTELMELSPRMRDYVLEGQILKRMAQERLRW